MSARSLRRQLGIIIACNGDACDSKFQTANVLIRVNRKAAAAIGWIRGGVKGRKLHDYCPNCAPAELAAVAEEKAQLDAKRTARTAALKAKDATIKASARKKPVPQETASA